MKLIQDKPDSLVIELTSREFTDAMSSIEVIDQFYESIDQTMLNVPLERIERLIESFSNVLEEAHSIRKKISATIANQ